VLRVGPKPDQSEKELPRANGKLAEAPTFGAQSSVAVPKRRPRQLFLLSASKSNPSRHEN
jgi:hypothetical protein